MKARGASTVNMFPYCTNPNWTIFNFMPGLCGQYGSVSRSRVVHLMRLKPALRAAQLFSERERVVCQQAIAAALSPGRKTFPNIRFYFCCKHNIHTTYIHT